MNFNDKQNLFCIFHNSILSQTYVNCKNDYKKIKKLLTFILKKKKITT